MSNKEKLNVEVDKLAGNYKDQLGVYSLITHIMYPLSSAALEID